MAAGPRDHEAPTPPETEAVDIRDLPPLREAPEQRVMSVSPSDAELGSDVATREAGDRDIFLAPRVLDQNSFDELAGRLRTLIDEANDALAKLQLRLDELRQRDLEPVKASARLQERLRLGARMLKAFQGQIGRVENSISELTSRKEDVEAVGRKLDETLAAFDARIENLTATSVGRVNELADEALRRFEQELAERRESLTETDVPVEEAIRSLRSRIAEVVERETGELEARLAVRREESARLDDRISESVQHADSLLKLVELAEQKTASLSHRQAASIASIEARIAEANEITRQCEEAGRILGQTLLSAAERIDQLDARSSEICKSANRDAARSEEAARELIQRLAEAGPLTDRLDQANGAAMELRELLERLRPWENLLLESERTADGTPRPVASMIETLQQGLAQDLAGLSLVMRDLADRVDRAIPLPLEPEKTAVVEVPGPVELARFPRERENDSVQEGSDAGGGDDVGAKARDYSQDNPENSRGPQSSSPAPAGSEPPMAADETETVPAP
ncbi:MAG: hypothetical protein JSV91_09495 [Phycisphaerales bacterium]|nr:MAG: hypothetical protein JSV91_09495 [Phycisphaerales bacterium]